VLKNRMYQSCVSTRHELREARACRCCRKSSVPMCCVLVQGGCFLCTCRPNGCLLVASQ
jgi:hypothetical protein